MDICRRVPLPWLGSHNSGSLARNVLEALPLKLLLRIGVTAKREREWTREVYQSWRARLDQLGIDSEAVLSHFAASPSLAVDASHREVGMVLHEAMNKLFTVICVNPRVFYVNPTRRASQFRFEIPRTNPEDPLESIHTTSLALNGSRLYLYMDRASLS